MNKDFLEALFDENNAEMHSNVQGILGTELSELEKNNLVQVTTGKISIISPNQSIASVWGVSDISVDGVSAEVHKLARLNDTSRQRAQEIKEAVSRIAILSKTSGDKGKAGGEMFSLITKVEDALKDLLKRKVLFIGAENKDKTKIDVESEYEILKNLAKKGRIQTKRTKPPTISQILKTWDEFRPSIVFFSCHGEENSLWLQNDEGKSRSFPATKIIEFFNNRTNYTDGVILSACNSFKIGEALASSCNFVISTKDKVEINTAREFTTRFFEHLESHGEDLSPVYRAAFNQAKELIQSKGLPNSYSFNYHYNDSAIS
ncbi:CHAT domain-containing protein [Flavobacteriaceae bacterium TK19130]|nr:CHAT domain-containing protein [Thermobacterium salinum]